MAASTTASFPETFERCKVLYGARSDAAHSGVTPIGVDEARSYALNSIWYVSANRAKLPNKRAIRAWLAQYAQRITKKARVGP
jgi:hypothetical protein